MKNELRFLIATFAGLMFATPWANAQDWFGDGDEGGKVVFALKRPGLSQVCVADADGSALKRLTPPEMSAYSPSWSPDGKAIVFVSEADKKTRICTVNSDGAACGCSQKPERTTDGHNGRRMESGSPSSQAGIRPIRNTLPTTSSSTSWTPTGPTCNGWRQRSSWTL